MKCGRYAEGAKNRQDALDYINANPGAVAPEIIAALKWDKVGGSERLTVMTGMGEVSRERVSYRGVNAKGQPYNVTTYSYTANQIKTRNAEEMMKYIADNLKANKLAPDAPPPKRPAWVSGPTNPNRKPIKNQEGIGSGRSRVWAGASTQMI